MRIAFIPTSVSGVMFYRVWQPAEWLRRNTKNEVAVLWYGSNRLIKHDWEWKINDNDTGIRVDIEMACEWADVVVWMELHQPESLELFKRLKRQYPKKPFLMEMDDNIISTPIGNVASTVYYPGSQILAIAIEQMNYSDGMIVSTPHLKTIYEPYNRNIHVVENAVDISLWRRRSILPRRRRVTLGWVGGAGHMADLLSIQEPLFEVLDKYPHVRFACLHGWPAEWEDHPQIICPRDKSRCDGDPRGERIFKPMNEYPKWVKSFKFDIGLAPLLDNNFNRSKSNLRWLEYSAQRIPTVASNVGHFRETIRHGETGFLASTKEEWKKYLSDLIESEYLRRTTGTNAMKEVKASWSPKTQAKKYLRVLKEIRHAYADKGRHCGSGSGLCERPERQPVVAHS